MPAEMLEKPPKYLEADWTAVRVELRALRDEGKIAAYNRRWYLRTKAAKR